MTWTYRHLIVLVAAVLVGNTVPHTAYGWALFGPKTYDECVLDKIKDANNIAAVIAVKESCRELFPLRKVALSSSAIKNIAASDTEFVAQSLHLTLHNNNPDWTVTNFKIAFIETRGKAGTVTPIPTTPPEGTRAIIFDWEEVITPYGKLTVSAHLDPNKAYQLLFVDLKGYQ